MFSTKHLNFPCDVSCDNVKSKITKGKNFSFLLTSLVFCTSSHQQSSQVLFCRQNETFQVVYLLQLCFLFYQLEFLTNFYMLLLFFPSSSSKSFMCILIRFFFKGVSEWVSGMDECHFAGGRWKYLKRKTDILKRKERKKENLLWRLD